MHYNVKGAFFYSFIYVVYKLSGKVRYFDAARIPGAEGGFAGLGVLFASIFAIPAAIFFIVAMIIPPLRMKRESVEDNQPDTQTPAIPQKDVTDFR